MCSAATPTTAPPLRSVAAALSNPIFVYSLEKIKKINFVVFVDIGSLLG